MSLLNTFYNDPMQQHINKFMLMTEEQNCIEKSTEEERLKHVLSHQLSGARFT